MDESRKYTKLNKSGHKIPHIVWLHYYEMLINIGKSVAKEISGCIELGSRGMGK